MAMAMAMAMEGEMYRFMVVWLSILASICYCYFTVSNIPKGTLRLLSLLPIFSLFSILPLFLTTVLLTGITAFFITWLANFKLLLFAFDLGPLSLSSQPQPSKSLPLFISITCFPIKINPDVSDSIPQKLRLNLPTKMLILALNIGILGFYKQQLHPNPTVVSFWCCFMLYLFVDTTLGLCNVILGCLITGMELELPSNEPYLATSLEDFWGRRWNLMVTHIMRHTVYLPVKSVAGSIVKGRWGPAVIGVLATFAVSGLMHELLFFYVTRASPSWEVTWFFLLHGGCLVLEKIVRSRWGLRWALSGPISVGFVVATAAWLFFPPLLRNGVEERAIVEYRSMVESITGKFIGG